ncbi:hypothetical protein CUMW_201050, partial [Citrus unshiu]
TERHGVELTLTILSQIFPFAFFHSWLNNPEVMAPISSA